MQNNYQMAFRDQTTGWDPSCNDVNAKNGFGMLPAEVALQAGDIKEFSAIISHSEFKTESLGRVYTFLAICRHDSEKTYQAIFSYFLDRFEFNESIDQFVKIN